VNKHSVTKNSKQAKPPESRMTLEIERDMYRGTMLGVAADLETERQTVNHLRSVVAACCQFPRRLVPPIFG
jgi:hypothetical protein